MEATLLIFGKGIALSSRCEVNRRPKSGKPTAARGRSADLCAKWSVGCRRWRAVQPPCLPTKASQPPSGDAWLHEIKHDGFRVIARKDGERVRRYSRLGNDLTYRFPLIVEALAASRLRRHWRAAGPAVT
jgi:ATP-dependent DNA ligase